MHPVAGQVEISTIPNTHCSVWGDLPLWFYKKAYEMVSVSNQYVLPLAYA